MKKGILFLPSLALLLSSCSFLFGSSQGALIEDVSTTVDGQGNQQVVLSFQDGVRPDFVLSLPGAASGADGATITDVTAQAEGEEIVITISLTGKDDVVFRVPNAQGEEGRLVTGLVVSTDEETGGTNLVFEYSDGTQSPSLLLPKGEDGVDATHLISSFEVTEEEGGTRVVLHYQDGSPDTVFFLPDGRDGVTIDHVEITEVTSTSCVYTFTLSDGSTFDLPLPYGRAQEWWRGMGEPSPSQGEVGDFYLDIQSGDFYAKEEAGWTFLLTIDGYAAEEEPDYYSVTFDAQGGSLPSGAESVSYFVQEGERLSRRILGEQIGIPERGDDLFLGWYTSPTYDPNAGRFDDTTPVLRDLQLYAWYDVA